MQDCIARDLAGDNLYRNTLWCIVTWEQGTWAGLYCNTATALATRRAGSAGRARHAGAGHWARDTGVQGERHRRVGLEEARGARGARAGAKHGRAGRTAWALGARPGRAVEHCTWCT